MNLKEVNKAISDEGFVSGLSIGCLNHKGEYIGGLLERFGFKPVEVIQNNRKWIEYEKDGFVFIGHRDLEEAKQCGTLNPGVYFPFMNA